jgi:hypothetical protein
MLHPNNTFLLGGFVSLTGLNRTNEEINQHLLRDENHHFDVCYEMGKRELEQNMGMRKKQFNIHNYFGEIILVRKPPRK